MAILEVLQNPRSQHVSTLAANEKKTSPLGGGSNAPRSVITGQRECFLESWLVLLPGSSSGGGGVGVGVRGCWGVQPVLGRNLFSSFHSSSALTPNANTD